ncbi:prepilin-type N-terminal cleavage/methylation domain-containing protein [Vibrio nitrifigilis]|uniref:Prepilin-type N-terminal cleavage/methylation domain-containing protein n=1 Tax=Vibrio nitrifigilis TaxID=2789781 RepID=A0ABS0GG89_9VIBR|nr:prepilin-type N-terminal cleavage/methylation domain-containing protein [Vibrio nitrifigilis]MBF9001355.1 prepilin-type N-terminal cleavage/methylation domain-containing protein [Vibrio nitrifigilis]
MAKKESETGFSLIELVVVIVVIGLLAVAALPKFLDVTDEAKKASIEGVAGGYATAVLSARAQWEAEARPQVTIGGQGYNSVNYDGVDFWLTRATDSSGNSTGFRDGYPLSVNSGNRYPTSLTDSACILLMENLLQNPPKVGTTTAAGNDSDVQYSAQADNAANTCTYVQQEGSTAHQFVYELATGQVTVTLQ